LSDFGLRTSSRRPWASGPGEILAHGIALLRRDSDTNRRLALLSIDNAVELTIKTYLGLPRRVSSLNLSRREYDEICESFPRLLDALNTHAADRLGELDLGEIEWYHRLRNQLYHQGNGLTVEKEKVVVYARLAEVLYENLFGVVPRVDIPQLARLPDVETGPRKAWFHLPALNLIAATVNSRGSCSVRTFLLPEGTAVDKKYGTGDYQQQFRTLLEGGRLMNPDRQPNLERECRERLPEDLLASFREQLASENRPYNGTAGDRILRMLRPEGKSFCDDCVSRLTGINPRQQVNGICRQLANNGKIERRQAMCYKCGQQKIVNRTVQGGSPAKRDSRPANS
jgi:hypothetical protein